MKNKLNEPVTFPCRNEEELWYGVITYIENYGSHYEMHIESRSALTVIFGKTNVGNFLCIPAFNVGSELAELRDTFWNTERLISILGEVDGITVAEALYYISDTI